MTISPDEIKKEDEREIDVSKKNIDPSQAPINHRKKSTLWVFTLGIFLIGIIWLLLWTFYFRFYESTDDAYAKGNLIELNSAISGSVIAFFADDTDLVIEGQLLVLLDETSYKVAFSNELASLATIVLQVRQIFENVLVNQANLESKQAQLSKAKYDYNNRLALVDSRAISNEDFIHSRDDLVIAESNLKQAVHQLEASKAAAGNTSLENHPLIEQQKARVRNAFYQLKHCAIYSPATGYVAKRSIEVGQWLYPNTPIMAIIPTNYVWVDANFKETQLNYMRIGQPAEVWFDLYGSKVKFVGKVHGIASGSGSVFSLIPPQNATGNWIKIVQRLPVRISLDPRQIRDYPVRLGISAEVKVNITDQNLPMLSQNPPTKPVASTKVFDIEMQEVESAIQEIIEANLKKDRS